MISTGKTGVMQQTMQWTQLQWCAGWGEVHRYLGLQLSLLDQGINPASVEPFTRTLLL